MFWIYSDSLVFLLIHSISTKVEPALKRLTTFLNLIVMSDAGLKVERTCKANQTGENSSFIFSLCQISSTLSF